MVAGKEQAINNVLVAVQAVFTSVQLQIMENAIREALRGYRLEEECTALSTCMDDNEYILNLFVANKKIEGCKPGSIEQYLRQSRDLFRRTNKNYKDITKDDIKLYLAWYGRGKSQTRWLMQNGIWGAFLAGPTMRGTYPLTQSVRSRGLNLSKLRISI